MRNMRITVWVENIIHTFYLTLFTGILIATTLIDKYNAQNKFLNQAKWANGGYYLFAVIIFGIFAAVYCHRKNHEFSDKKYYIILTVIFLSTLLIQILVALWTPALSETTDFGRVRDMAITLANGGSFESVKYFSLHPNNTNIVILLSLIYKISNSWKLVIWAGAFLTNLSIIIMAVTIKKITGNKTVSLIICLTAEILIALSWRAFIPYTDNFGMPFIAGMVFVFVSNIKKEIKAPLVLTLGMLGAWIKITALIPLIAIILYAIIASDIPAFIKSLIKDCSTGNTASHKGQFLSLIICCFLLFLGGSINSTVNNHYKIEQSNEARGWQFMFMVGQAFENTGQVKGSDYAEKWKEITSKYSERSDRLKACFKQAVSWIKDRGIIGNIVFYIKKLNVAFNDGCFHNTQPYSHKKALHNIIYEFYSKYGKYYKSTVEIRQILWDMIIVMLSLPILLHLFFRNKVRTVYVFFELSIIGIIIYLFLFEGRSKYLYMFLPLILSYAGIMMDKALNGITLMSEFTKKYISE